MDANSLGFEPPALWIVVRLVCATLTGAVIGWNRHRVGKPAGIGTHALVALGAGLFVAIPVSEAQSHPDAVSRAIQGVAAGVGFLGAGEIFRDPGAGKVTGLTSAAALWATAALGLMILSGPLTETIAATVLVLMVLELAPRIERRLPSRDRENGGATR